MRHRSSTTRLAPFFAAAALLCGFQQSGSARAAAPLLLRNPSLGADQIAFRYADDVWTVPRQGGTARRLTSVGAVVSGPFFSPDGTQIAYSMRKAGLTDVYVVAATGGVPRRLTWDPDGSLATGWTPDGKDVLLSSFHSSPGDYPRLYRVRADGQGAPVLLPLPSAVFGNFSADGATLAYQPVMQWQAAWKHYRGGQTSPVWLVNMRTLDLEKVPRENSNDSHPVWAGGSVYFLSDRGGPVSVWNYDPASKQVREVIPNHGLDFKSLGAGGDALVYEQFGSLHLYDLKSGQERAVPVAIDGDLPALVPQIQKIAPGEVQHLAISPTGARLAAEAHGEIFTLPAEKGDARNLTRTPGVAERDPAWSPDGKTIAYFSDASGEYQLHLRDQDGLKPARVIDLGPEPSFFYRPTWSPDSKFIAYWDKHLHLSYVDVASGVKTLIDTGLRGGFEEIEAISWSPDSKWLAYARDLESGVHAIFLHSLATKTSTQVTDGMSNAGHPRFDPNGKYLYFTASTNNGPSDAGIDLSSLDRGVSSGVYAIVLARNGVSPVAPESDEENNKKSDSEGTATDKADGDKPAGKGEKSKDGDKSKDGAKAKPAAVTTVDLADIGNRTVALPIPERNYVDLAVGKTGVLFLAEGAPVGRPSVGNGPPIHALWRFTTEKRMTEELLSGLNAFGVSADGEKLSYTRGDSWFIASVGELKPGSPEAPQGKPVGNSGMTMTVDLRSEWRQMYAETWRIQRDFLYDPHLHGLDLEKITAKYRPYLENLGARSEFSYLSEEMLGELQLGHVFVSGPRDPSSAPKPGLLGADYTLDKGRYRFAKIYNGQNWTPGLAAPLTVPGVQVDVGDYLLAVNGRELRAEDNVNRFFDGLAGKQTVIRVGKSADGAGGRDVTVVPVDSEHGLRVLDWIEGNRRKVDALSGGKVAYVYMPNTAGAGYTNFNRYFYAQLDRQGLVLDERYNEGGFIADYVINVLGQQRLSGAIERDGKPIHDPVGAIFGPKVMIINQSAGSGGDAMPWYFRKAKLGTLLGTKTWGGLVGIGGYPRLIDGGGVTAPRYAIYGLNGEWEVEGHGIAPDIVVEEFPKDVAGGHDVQLERAVSLVLQQLQEHPIVAPPVPPYPNYHDGDDVGRRPR